MTIARRRGELVSELTDEAGMGDYSHFFHGHVLTEGTEFSIAPDNGMTPVKVMVGPLAGDETGEGLFGTDPQRRPRLGLRINLGDKGPERPKRLFSAEGALIRRSAGLLSPYRGETSGTIAPVQFITPESLEMRPLAAIWDQILLDSQEGEVIAAMKILDPKIESIAFLTGQGEAPRFPRGRAGIVASFSDDKRRVPLGSCGDGMRRLLALSAALIRAKDGFLIVDEIDTGFHYSVMTDVWKLVASTAEKLNIQVFATTHSLDCIRGLAEVCRGSDELRASVSLNKILRELESSVPLSGEELITVAEQDLEVR